MADTAATEEVVSVRPLVEARSITAAVLSELPAADEIKCVAIHGCAAVIGTRLGSLLHVDHNGNQVRMIWSNSAQVCAAGFDREGCFCACGLSNGRVAVVPVPPRGTGDPWICEHGSLPVISVALCPDYTLPGAENHSVCTGGEDGRLLLHRRGLFNGHAPLHEGEGFVTRICWRSPLIAWANEKGVKIYNASTGQKVTFIPRPPNCVGGVSSRCALAWARDDRLLVGWGTVVKVAALLGKPLGGGASEGSGANSSLYVEVRNQFSCPEHIAGLADAGSGNLAVLTADTSGRRATFSLCSSRGEVFHILDMPGCTPGQLHFGSVAPHMPMFLSAPRDLSVLQVRDLLEHAVQLLEAGQYDDAIRLADGGGDSVQGLRHIVCLKCVAPDLRSGSFERACTTIGRFRELEAPTWQECIMQFDRFGGLQYLAVNIPVPPRSTRLPQEVYDDALGRLVAFPSALVAVLSWWPPDIFSVGKLEEKLRGSLPDRDSSSVPGLNAEDRCRKEALALLNCSQGNLVTAAQFFLELGSPEVFRLLRRGVVEGQESAAELIRQNVRQLYEIDDREACSLLVDQHANVPVDAVMQGLQGCDNRWRHEYLKQLFAKDEVAGHGYHMLMVRLFAEYEPGGLLPFLRSSERYPLEDALSVCQQQGLLEEEAYLLGRAGRVEKALHILLEKVGDVERAVAFAAEYQDPKLWEELVSFVLNHPHLLVPLLEKLDALDTLYGKVGSDSGRPQPPPTATPAHVLRRLPPGTPVPRIASSVRRVFDSFTLSTSLHVSCSKLSVEEMTSRKKAFINAHLRGSMVAPSSSCCEVCGRLISRPPPELEAEPQDIGIRLCGQSAVHVYSYEQQMQAREEAARARERESSER